MVHHLATQPKANKLVKDSAYHRFRVVISNETEALLIYIQNIRMISISRNNLETVQIRAKPFSAQSFRNYQLPQNVSGYFVIS